MKPQVIKADVGCIVNFPHDSDVYYVGEKVGDEVCFQDKKAFRERQGICYCCHLDWLDEVGWDENVSDEMYEWMAKHPQYEGIALDTGYTFLDLYDVVYDWIGDTLNDVDDDVVDEFCEYFTGVLFANLVCGDPSHKIQDYDPLEEYQNWLQLGDNDPRLTPEQRKELGYE